METENLDSSQNNQTQIQLFLKKTRHLPKQGVLQITTNNLIWMNDLRKI